MWDQYGGVACNNELQHVGRARPRAARKPGVCPRTRRGPAHRTCELVKEEAAHRVYDLRYGLVISEGPEPAGHTAGLNKGAAGEGEREEPDEAGLLHRLDATHQEPYSRRDPGEGEAEEQQQTDGGCPTRHAGLGPEADEEADHQHNEDNERVAGEVGDGAAGEDSRAGHGERAKPVDEPLLEILGQADTGGHGPEGDGLHEDPDHKEVYVRGAAAHVDGAAEDVTEQ